MTPFSRLAVGLVAASALSAAATAVESAPARKLPRQRTTDHKHSREIARRQRQEARLRAKRGEA